MFGAFAAARGAVVEAGAADGKGVDGGVGGV